MSGSQCNGRSLFAEICCPVRGTILNISRQGCAILSDTALETEAYLQLHVQLLEKEEPVHVDLAAVRWSTARKFGVEFIKMHHDVGERLKQFVQLLESDG